MESKSAHECVVPISLHPDDTPNFLKTTMDTDSDCTVFDSERWALATPGADMYGWDAEWQRKYHDIGHSAEREDDLGNGVMLQPDQQEDNPKVGRLCPRVLSAGLNVYSKRA